jgi:diaminopimelate epimerase
MRFGFHKMHGLGNDFVVIDARAKPVSIDAARSHAIADRQRGIGCDQLILLEPSDCADLRMRIFNADGAEVEQCGNALRCVAQLTGAGRIETRAGLTAASAHGALISIDMGMPRFGWDEIPLSYAVDTADVPAAWGELDHGVTLNVGNPHIVFFVPDPDAVPLAEFGPSIEHDPMFPDRVNVNVAEVTGPSSLRLRVWERGSGLTQACGTGACATAVAAIRRKLVQSPVTVSLPGGDLVIAWAPGESVRMSGPATHVFFGEAELEAFG